MRGKGRRRYPRVARPRSLTPVASTSRGLPLRPSGRAAVVFVARAGMDAMSSMNRPPRPRRRGLDAAETRPPQRVLGNQGASQQWERRGRWACLWACRTDLGSDGVAGFRRSWKQGVPPPCRVAVVDLARSASSEALRTSMGQPPPARPCLPREGDSGRHPASAAMDSGTMVAMLQEREAQESNGRRSPATVVDATDARMEQRLEVERALETGRTPQRQEGNGLRGRRCGCTGGESSEGCGIGGEAR